MSAFKKFLPGRKKAKKSTSASIQSSTSEQNISDLGPVPGYRNVKEKDLPKLHKAAWIGDMAKLKQLVKKGDVNLMDKHHRTPLHYACVKGHGDIVQWLCANRANLGICDEDGRTALMKAVECASESCLEILLNHGAETNVVDVNLTTPLHIAATHGSIPIATLLLERDARVNAPDTDKITPLYVACSLGFPEFVDFLLQEFALVNEPDASGRSPLIAASMEGHTEVIKVLLRYGADTDMKDLEGWKATDHAAMAGYHSISELIEEHVNDQQQEEAKPAPQERNSNFGSAIGSPFRSTSTQPASSTFGGPAINITVDSEDESFENDSPRRSDFQNSWADTESETEDEPKKAAPNLAFALKRSESTQSKKTASKIPLASSKEKLNRKDETESKKANTSTETKIPKFESGLPQKTASKENATSQASAIPKSQSKIPTSKSSSSNLLSPKHQASKDENLADSQSSHSVGYESKIPRLAKSNSFLSKENVSKTGIPTINSPEKRSPERNSVQEGRRDSLGWENADFSDFGSDSEEFSETDLLAALTGSPAKKVPIKANKKPAKMDPPESPAASSPLHPNEEATKDSNEASEENENLSEQQDKIEDHSKQDTDKKIAEAKDDEPNEDSNEWDSTTEDVTPPKPVLANILKKKEVEDAKDKEEFDLGTDLDTSEGTNEFSSPELMKKPQQPSPNVPTIEEGKNEEESEFSDFSLQETQDEIEKGMIDSPKKEEDGRVNESEEKKGRKDSKGLKTQMEALGLEFGSSISSFSETENIQESDTSIAKHDGTFSPTKSTTEKSQNSTELKADSSEEEIENPSPVASPLKGREDLKKEKEELAARKVSSSKAQYDALGIEFSDESESALETESEWEASLRKKKVEEKSKDTEARQKKEELSDADKHGLNDTIESEEQGEQSENQSSNEEQKSDVMKEEGSPKNDSEFVSDESFSLNTEDQLEELEEARINNADGLDRGGDDGEDELAKDFNDSDFSLTESSRNESKLDVGNDSREKGESGSESEAIKRKGENKPSEELTAINMEKAVGDLAESVKLDERTADSSSEFADIQVSSPKKKTSYQGNVEKTNEMLEDLSDSKDEESDSLSAMEIKDVYKEKVIEGSVKKHEEERGDNQNINDVQNEQILEQIAKPEIVEAAKVVQKSSTEDHKRKASDAEGKRMLEAMVKPTGSETTVSVDRGLPGGHKRKNSEAERKKMLEAMAKPVNIQPAIAQNVESRMDFGAMIEEISSISEDGSKKEKTGNNILQRDQTDEIEEEFERQLQEKEMERRSVSPKQKDENEENSSEIERKLSKEREMERSIEEFEGQLKLKEEEQKAIEEKKKKEMEFEKQRMKLEMERRIKKHQEELRQKERSFEEELRRRENEEKEKRQKQLFEWEKEKKSLEELRKKSLEDEFRKLEEEKKAWEQKKRLQDEKLHREKTDLEEIARKRMKEQMEAVEAERRLKEQEELWERKKIEFEKTEKGKDNYDDDEKRKAVEELLEIERYMREKEEAEGRKINEDFLEEDAHTLQALPYKGRFLQREDYITPVKRANDYVENQLELEPVNVSLLSQSGTSPKSNDLKREEAVGKLEESKKMREEAALLLQAAREKTNALMSGERVGGTTKTSPRQKPLTYEDMSDYGSADVDEVIRGNGTFQQHRDDINDMIPTPGSDAVDTELRNDRRGGSPTTSTPYGRYDAAMPEFNRSDNRSPIIGSKNASGLVKDDFNRSPSPHKTATPLALYTSLSQTGHFQDSKALMKMQDSLRESKREMEKMKEKNSVLESMKREMEADVREMQRTVEILSKSQTDFERHRLDMEMEMRDMRYRLEQEIEAKTAAEGLVVQLKEQIKRGDEKLSAEAEARQTIELAYKTLEAEFKLRENITSQLQNDVNDLKFTLHHERESRVNQEQLYREQLQQHEALLEEAQRTSFQHAQTVNQLELIDQNRQSAESAANQLKVNLAKAQGELTRVSAQLEEVKSTYESEVSRLRNKLQDKADELVKSEREQFQVHMQLEAEKSTAKAEQMRLISSFDNEAANKKRLQTEVNVLKTQLQNASNELERFSKTKTLTESEVSKYKEESYKDRNKHDRELANAKDEAQRVFAKLDASERRCDTLESELQSAKIALAEQSGQLVMSSREAEYKGNLLNQMEEKLRHEKELNHRLSSKIDGGSERTSILQREIDNLRRELETANLRTSDCDRAARDAQEKFQTLLSKAKEDFEKERNNLEQRLMQLSEAALRYKEEHAEDKEEIKSKDNEIRLIEKEMNELARRLSAAEAAKEIQSKAKDQLESEKARLSKETAILERKLDEVSSSKNELEGKVIDLSEQLDHVMKVSDHTNNRLVRKTADAQSALSSRAEVEKAITRLKIEKAELESELREEQGKSEMILDDLRKSNDARESLEKMLANLKVSNVHLEEKLQSEALSRVQRERDAEDHRDLWNSEVRSRSKLGLKLVTLEKEIQALKTELEEEKRKKMQAEEMQKNLDSKLEVYDKRSLQQQKEASALKNKLRQYQRRIKDFENGESRIPKLYAEFEREREVMLNNASNLRRQVDSLSDQLRQEQDSRTQAQIGSKRNDQELNELRAREKVLSFEKSKLERENQSLEDELDRLKNYYEQNFVNKGNLESFKRDIETKARLEINRKLADVNMQLEEQAVAREAYDRVRSETESKTKKEFEETINELKNELSGVKSALQDGIVKKSTYETEAGRIRELYENEMAEKLLLSEQVNKLNEQFANSKARLSLEKRNQQLMDLTSRVSPSKTAHATFLNAERDDYGSRPGLRPVDLTTSTPFTKNSFATSNPRASTAARDFWPTYQRNYLT